jgi:hypothetical protein
MNQVFNNDPSAARLTQLVKSREVVVFIGSGLSTGAYPAWHELVLSLCKRCGVASPGPLNSSTAVDVLIRLAGDAQKADEDAYLKALQESFAKQIHIKKKEYELLMALPFRSYVTINFDPLLADEKNRPEYRDRMLIAYPYAPTKYLGSQNLFYIHGYMRPGQRPTSTSIVLTPETFRKAYADDDAILATFWDVLLTEHCVLFVASGLREPELQLAIKRSQKKRSSMVQRGEKPPPLFILRPAFFLQDDALETRERDHAREQQEQSELAALDIRIVRYDMKDTEHTGLLEVLEFWNPPPTMNEYSTEKEVWCQP